MLNRLLEYIKNRAKLQAENAELRSLLDQAMTTLDMQRECMDRFYRERNHAIEVGDNNLVCMMLEIGEDELVLSREVLELGATQQHRIEVERHDSGDVTVRLVENEENEQA